MSDYSQMRSPAPKDPDTAFLIEIVGGLFGALGLGYIYAGRTEEGVIRLIVWLIYVLVAWVIISLLMAVIIGCVLAPIQIAIQVIVPLWSANTLKNSMIG